jgi:hypothetical protein
MPNPTHLPTGEESVAERIRKYAETREVLVRRQDWFASTPRQQGKSLFQRCVDAAERAKLAEEYKPVAWDLAKPGADHARALAQSLKDTLAFDDGRCANDRALFVDPAPVIPEIKAPDPDHIWNMIVLAAESSRYDK